MRKFIRTAFLAIGLGVLAPAAPPAHATFPGEQRQDRLPVQPRRQLRDLHDERGRPGPDPADEQRREPTSTPAWSADGNEDRVREQPRRQLRDLHDERRRHRARRGSRPTRRTTGSRPGRRTARRSPSTRNRDGNFEIYTMNADGTGATRLTNNAADDTQPAWSPDGTRIAFTDQPRRRRRDLHDERRRHRSNQPHQQHRHRRASELVERRRPAHLVRHRLPRDGARAQGDQREWELCRRHARPPIPTTHRRDFPMARPMSTSHPP